MVEKCGSSAAMSGERERRQACGNSTGDGQAGGDGTGGGLGEMDGRSRGAISN